MSDSIIHVVAGCYVNNREELLIVRKHNTTAFMLPGGKPEANELPEVTLKREWQEELGVTPTGHLELLGHFQADAANEQGYQVMATTYLVHQIANESHSDGDKISDNDDVSYTTEISCAAEIEEFRWLPLSSLKDSTPDLPELAPLLKNEITPKLIQRYQRFHS